MPGSSRWKSTQVCLFRWKWLELKFQRDSRTWWSNSDIQKIGNKQKSSSTTLKEVKFPYFLGNSWSTTPSRSVASIIWQCPDAASTKDGKAKRPAASSIQRGTEAKLGDLAKCWARTWGENLFKLAVSWETAHEIYKSLMKGFACLPIPYPSAPNTLCVCLGTQNHLQNHLQKGMEHKGIHHDENVESSKNMKISLDMLFLRCLLVTSADKFVGTWISSSHHPCKSLDRKSVV